MAFDECALTRRAMLGVVLAAASAPLFAASRLTLAEVVRRNTRARGGAAALDRMHALGVDVEIVEGGQALHGRYAANRAGLVRIDVYAGGRHVGSEGVDGNGVWILGKNGPEPSVAAGAGNALTNGAENHLFGWNRFPQRGHKLALMPSQTVEGITYPVVEVRYSTGHVSYFYVDPGSWQAVRRRDQRAYHPDVSQSKQHVETRMSDFRAVQGIVAAQRSEDYDLDSGKLLSTNRTLARRINPRLAADYFDRNRRVPESWA